MQKIATAATMRPKTFDDLLGQEFVAGTLKSAIRAGRVASAYLFSGPRGVGKTSAARILARALNCPEVVDGEPCGSCDVCSEIIAGSALDIIEIDGASNTSVDHVRQIIDEVLFAPSRGPYKIYIIDEVHMLSASAFNALLKTIEEPPAYVVFVFATTELHKVPATIKSRCQQFSFRLIHKHIIAKRLHLACEQQGIEAEAEAIAWIASEANGSLRDALTLFDQVAAFSEGHIALERTAEVLGFLGLDKVAKLVGYLAAGDMTQALEFFYDRLQAGVAIERLVKECIDYFRGHLFASAGVKDSALLGWREAPVLPEGFGAAQCEAALEILFRLYGNLRDSADPQADVEVALYRIGRLPQLLSAEALVAELRALMQQAPAASAAYAANEPAVASNPASEPRVVEPRISREHILILRNQAREAKHPLATLISSLTGYAQKNQTLIFKTNDAEVAKKLYALKGYICDAMLAITGFAFDFGVSCEAPVKQATPAAPAKQAAQAPAAAPVAPVSVAATAVEGEDLEELVGDDAAASGAGGQSAHQVASLAAEVFRGKMTMTTVSKQANEEKEA